ncbi:MAG: glycolate oxidase subunit GlcF, partial [Comamonadaceae bacterium]
RTHERKVLMLAGCVQPSMMPNINSATARVLDAAGIQTVIAPEAGCCGAVKFHLNDQDGGTAQMRANIDAWWPLVERNEVEAIVMNASGCGVTVREYGHILRDDAAYALKARRIGELTRDLSELLPDLVPVLKSRVTAPGGVVAYHPPCTLQHGQKLRGGVEVNLRALGFDIQVARNESHLCCGSAGTYSVLQPDLAYPLRDRKLGHLKQLQPTTIVSANIGCITHLQSGSALPVRHWIELLDGALDTTEGRAPRPPQS